MKPGYDTALTRNILFVHYISDTNIRTNKNKQEFVATTFF